MSVWSGEVEEPFRSDDPFWRSVTASLWALVALLAAAVVVGFFGARAGAVFVAPAALLVLAARQARRSTARTRPQFASREEWRDAERRAVAAALRRGARRR